MLKMESDALVALNWAIFCSAFVSTIFGIISVTADPASRMHRFWPALDWHSHAVRGGSDRIVAALSFRDGSRAEKVMALLRCIAVLICLLYGVLISVEAPKGGLTDESKSMLGLQCLLSFCLCSMRWSSMVILERADTLLLYIAHNQSSFLRPF